MGPARTNPAVAVTRAVSPALGRCELTHLPREPIDAAVAEAQHRRYEEVLAGLGLVIHRLPPAPELPDSVFVEDTAVVVEEVAVIARPGAASRRPETRDVAQALKAFRALSVIEPPGTLDGGDVLRLGKSVFVGLSGRTNRAGLDQLRAALRPHGYTVTGVELTSCLHLKTAVTQVAPATILVNRAWVDPAVFGERETIDVDPSEPFGANALLAAGTVVYPAAFPRTLERLEQRGMRVQAVDVSELGKAEGGVTCCCLLL